MKNLVNIHAALISVIITSNAEASLKQYNADKQFDESTIDDCIKPYDDSEELCSVPVEDRISAFQHALPIPSSIQLDIRPADCQSFFNDFLHTRRGLRIESALATSIVYAEYKQTAANFPVVDFYSNGRIRVVKTRDLSADAFASESNAQNLYDQIIDDALAIQERILDVLEPDSKISTTSNGITTTIVKSDARSVTLDIIVQAGIATQSQIDQIEKAKLEIFGRWRFRLQVIEIP